MAGDAPNLSHQGFAASPKPTALDFQPTSNYRVSLKEGRELKQAVYSPRNAIFCT